MGVCPLRAPTGNALKATTVNESLRASKDNAIEATTVNELANRGIRLESVLLELFFATKAKKPLEPSCTTVAFWEKWLKPRMQGYEMSYTEFLGQKYGDSKKPVPAQIHLVHSWSMRHRDTLLAAAQAVNELNGGPLPEKSSDYLDVAWHRAKCPTNLNTGLFICTYVVDQHSLNENPIGSPSCQIDKFHLVAQKIYRMHKNQMVIAMDDESTALGRSACLEEVHAAIVNHMPLKLCGTEALTFRTVDARKARAHSQDVQAKIQKKISALPMGVDGFNKCINEKIQELAQSRCRQTNLDIGHAMSDESTQTYLFIGNPGTGKSAILNGLIAKEKVLFKSGVSFGSGLTQVLQQEWHRGDLYMDTPGLNDTQRKEQAAREITLSLKKGGNYHVFFVVTLLQGRVHPADTATMRLVLESAPITHYSVIINQVLPETAELLEEPGSQPREAVIAELMAGLEVQTNDVLIIERDDELDGKNNKLWNPIPERVRRFIRSAPGMHISECEVKDIDVLKLEATVKEQTHLLEGLRNDVDFLRAELLRQEHRGRKVRVSPQRYSCRAAMAGS